jgi:hypothetical protein
MYGFDYQCSPNTLLHYLLSDETVEEKVLPKRAKKCRQTMQRIVQAFTGTRQIIGLTV